MTGAVEQAARDVEDGPAATVAARAGLTARGLLWLVIGLLALQVLLGQDEQADQGGALRAIAGQPLGTTLLVLLALSFAAYALWMALQAAVGHRDLRDRKRTAKRAVSGVKAVTYGFLAASTAGFLLRGGDDADDSTASRTAVVLELPGGRLLVGLVGLVLLGVGAYYAKRGLGTDHEDCLDRRRLRSPWRRRAVRLGVVGLVGRGVVFALVGAFLVRAAVLADAREAKGLDAALQAVAVQPYGRVLLGLTVVGVLAYALWSFVEAVFRDV